MTISDERLAEMVGAGVPCLPAQPGEIAAVVQEIRALRAIPRGGIEDDPALAYQDAEERICECGAAGSGEGHSDFCPWLESAWKKWGDAFDPPLSAIEQEQEREYDPDAPADHSADNAADFIFKHLSKALGVDGKWSVADGSETWEGDVSGTLFAILIAAGILDEYTGQRILSPSVCKGKVTEEMVERSAIGMWRAELDDLSPAASRIRHAADWSEEGEGTKNTWRRRARAALTAARVDLQARLSQAVEHVEQLAELLDIIKEHWIDYDHVFSIAVHEARQFLDTQGGGNG